MFAVLIFMITLVVFIPARRVGLARLVEANLEEA